MAHQVLYRAYRPTNFKEVVGQDYIIKTLQNAIKQNNIAHAYLFCGPRGTGKTSVAKIFAKAINCLNSDNDACNECDSCISANNNTNPDIIEFDAASHSRVEEIREILKYINYAPTTSKYKVYIIDEVHMLSTSAFNAFLKTLEEPPAHVIFILATTEPNKVIPTVLSRCQRFNFSKIRPFEIKQRMIEILDNEKTKYEEEALDIIANLAEGGMRDALSLLEQYLAYNRTEVNKEDVQKLFSLSKDSDKIDLLINAHTNNVAQAIISLRKMYQEGVDVNRLTSDLLEIIKETLIYSDSMDDSLLTRIKKLDAQKIIQTVSVEKLIKDISILEDVLTKTRANQSMLSYLELALIKMTDNAPTLPVKEETKQKVIKEEIKEEAKVETNILDLKDLLEVLKVASKEQKVTDEIIINRIEMFRYDEKYRKIYALLAGTKLFASSEDALIITGNLTQAESINNTYLNSELINFINDNYNINKVVFGITPEQQNELIDMYRNLTPEEKANVKKINKPEIKKPETKEEKLKEIFPGLKVEE